MPMVKLVMELKGVNRNSMLADEYLDFQALSVETVGGTSVTIHLYVGDVDQVVAKAVAAKAIVLEPAKDQFLATVLLSSRILLDINGTWPPARKKFHPRKCKTAGM